MSQFDNSLDEINLSSELENVVPEMIQQQLSIAVKKLSKGGILKIKGIDFGEICRAFHQKHLSLIECERLLTLKTSFSTLEIRCAELETQGLTIIVKRLNGYEYYIEAQRC